MGSPWPAPQADEQIDSGRQPNFLLRRAVAVLVVVAIVGGAIAWFVNRGDGDDDGSATSGADWDTVVLQGADGEVTLVGPEGDEIESFPSEQMGLLDVGLEGRVVLGTADDPSVNGLAIMDLADGEVTEITVAADGIAPLDTSSFLLASQGPSDPLELVDPATGTVTDLRTFADAVEPIVNSSLVRIDPGHTHVAFTELTELETVLVDLETNTSVSLAGSLVDIADGVVLAATNRGQTTLIDLYRFDGERIGTVETDEAAGGMLLDGSSALIVTRAGALVRVDFDDESVDELGSVAEHLSTEPATQSTDGDETEAAPSDADLVTGVVALADRSRVVIVGEAGMVIADREGAALANDRVESTTIGTYTSADRCVLVGGFDVEQTLWDTTDGTRIETFDPGFITGRSVDGCTITYTERSGGGQDARSRFVGPGVDRSADEQLGAVAPDGSTAIGRDGEAAFLLDAATGDRIDLPVDSLFAVFVQR
jgi:hypothetical protein